MAFVLFLVVSGLFSGAVRAAPPSVEDRLIIGVLIRGEEVDAVDALVIGDRYFLPLDNLFAPLGLRYRDGQVGGTVDTPLGTTALSGELIYREGGQRFVSEDFFREALSADVAFDEERYAIAITPPWGKDARFKDNDSSDAETADAEFDVGPPPAGVSSVHGDIYANFDGSGDAPGVVASFETYGHAGGGVWRFGYNDDFNESREVSEYAWLREVTPHVWAQLGRQRVSLHPLLDTADLTGAQIAFANRENAFDQLDGLSGGLLDRYGSGGRRFEGTGPPGGRVELRIDDRFVDEAIIDVSGVYEIENPLPGRGRNEIELRIFDPLTGSLVERITQVLSGHDLIAPVGSFGVMAGAGIAGNALEGDNEVEPTGFAWVRYAPADILTLEVAVRAEESEAAALLGGALQLGEYGTLSGAVAANADGQVSYDVEFYGETERLALDARARSRAGDGDAVRDDDYYARLSYTHSSRLRFGAIARDSEAASFILPFVVWRPERRLYFSARPNRDGDYQLEARAALSRDADVRLFYERDASLRFTQHFATEATGASAFTFDLEYFDADETYGAAAGLSGSSVYGLDLDWRVRAGWRDDSGFVALGVNRRLRPGVLAYADASYGLSDDMADGEARVTLGLSFDLGVRSGGVVAANRFGADPARGLIAGRVVMPTGAVFDTEALENARVIVDGQIAGRVEADGGFWLSDVPRGVHLVELEADALPIDLVEATGPVRAHVAPGAVTSLDFELEISVGAAGRISDPTGRPLEGMKVEVLDASGAVVSAAYTSAFGLYRVDSLRPGEYRLRATGPGWSGNRTLTIGNEYFFGADLAVEATPDLRAGDRR